MSKTYQFQNKEDDLYGIIVADYVIHEDNVILFYEGSRIVGIMPWYTTVTEERDGYNL